jgi:hypothetical protein
MLKAIKSQNHAIHQAVIHLLLTVEACIEFQDSEMGFVVHEVETEQVFLQFLWFSLVNYLSTNAPNSCICHPGTDNVPIKSNVQKQHCSLPQRRGLVLSVIETRNYCWLGNPLIQGVSRL